MQVTNCRLTEELCKLLAQQHTIKNLKLTLLQDDELQETLALLLMQSLPPNLQSFILVLIDEIMPEGLAKNMENQLAENYSLSRFKIRDRRGKLQLKEITRRNKALQKQERFKKTKVAVAAEFGESKKRKTFDREESPAYKRVRL